MALINIVSSMVLSIGMMHKTGYQEFIEERNELTQKVDNIAASMTPNSDNTICDSL